MCWSYTDSLWNSSSNVNTTCGLKLSISSRTGLISSCTPSGRTSWPAARKVLTTSNSVFHPLISRAVYPSVESGGTQSGCISTRMRRRLIERSICAQVVYTLLEEFHYATAYDQHI